MSYREGGNYRPNNNYQPHRSGVTKPPFQKNNRYNTKSHTPSYQSNYQNQNHQSSNYQNTNYQNSNKPVNQDNGYQKPGYQSGSGNFEKKFDPFQIWMGDLDPNWDEQVIRSIWIECGENPTNVKLMKDKSGIKPTYCFVSFQDQDQVKSAIKKHGQQIPGFNKYFKLNWASGGNPNGAQNTYNNYNNHNQSFPAKNLNPFEKLQTSKADSTSCFISNLPLNATETMIFERLNKEYPNQVRQVRLMTDPATRVSKGFGFVKFISQEIAKQAAIELNGILIGNKPIKVLSSTNGGSNKVVKREVHTVQPQPVLNQFSDPNNTILIIKNLNQKFTQEELELHFISYGDLVYCRMSNDRTTCTAKYYLRAAAELALLNLHGLSIKNYNLKITWGKEGSEYVAAEAAPPLYGQFKPYHVNLSTTEVDQLIEPSESLLIANELYISSKLNRDKILNRS